MGYNKQPTQADDALLEPLTDYTNQKQQTDSELDETGSAGFFNVGLPVLFVERDEDVQDSEEFTLLARIRTS